ncbi:MAG: FdhD protein [Chloroflexota bacterium]|nr:FdhD protein [Chloroflexota bacterium]
MTQRGRTVRIVTRKLRDGELQQVADVVATEEPLEIRIVPERDGGLLTQRISVTMRTPGNDFELAAGFLFTEGIVTSREAIAGISYCVDVPDAQQYNVVNVALAPGVAFDAERLQRNFYTTSSCGVCGKGSLEALEVQGCRTLAGVELEVRAEMLCGLQDTLRAAQRVFRETGGLHAAGLFDAEGRLLVLREDVGRHNALDKLVGERLLAGEVPLAQRVLMVSGRTSFELMQKAAMASIPIVVGVGAPSSLAVETARTFGMTLVGFLRRDGFNVYAGSERVLA